MKSLPRSVNLEATSNTTISVDCEKSFLVANCPASEQYDDGSFPI